MAEYLIVGLIVLAAALYVLRKYLPRALRERFFGKQAASAGCASGCGSCGSGCETPATPGQQAPDGRRVIKLHTHQVHPH